MKNRTSSVPPVVTPRQVLVILIPVLALALSQVYGSDNLFSRVLLASSLAIWSYVVGRAIQSQHEHFVVLCFGLFNMVGIVLPAMFQTASESYPWFGLTYSSEIVRSASFLVLVYTVFFALAYSISLGRLNSAELRAKKTGRVARREIIEPLSAIVVPIFAAAAIGVVLEVGPDFFVSRRVDAVQLFLGTSGNTQRFLAELTLANVLGFLALAFALTIVQRRGKFSVGAIANLIIGLVAFAVGDYPLNGSRSTFAALLIALIALRIDTRKPALKALFAAAYIFGILIVMPAWNILGRGAPGSAILGDVLRTYRTTPDYDGFQSIMDIIMWTQDTGLKWGGQMLSALLFFVPHDLWPGKAAATGIAAARYMGYFSTNISAPLPAEFYADFGMVGTIVLSALAGLVFAAADKSLDGMSARGATIEKLPLVLLAGFSTIIARGALLSVIGPVLAAIGASICSIMVTTRNVALKTVPKNFSKATVRN